MNRIRTAQIPVKDLAAHLKSRYTLRRNLNKELEVNNKIITEAIRHEIHVCLCEKFGNVSRVLVERILENAREAKHIPYEFAPKLGWVEGTRYYVLYETPTEVLHECSDKIYRVRQMKDGIIYTTTCGRDLLEAIRMFNTITGNNISQYNLNL